MGKFKRRKRGAEGADSKNANVWLEFPHQKKNLEPRSPVFEAYYRAQGIVRPDEWDTFMHTLAVPLPASFRINLDCDFADVLLAEIEKHAGRMKKDEAGNDVKAIKKLEWFYGGRAYQLAIDRRTLRRDDDLHEFHELIKAHTEAGIITRQEAVSMIPPVVLDVQPHHKVLDMCAAPGSKTSQMMESVSVGCSRTGQEPKGYVVANDSDTSRAYMLVHQCKRINTLALCVTTHKAQCFPNSGGNWLPGTGPFDRVLCDVPCSGDGTVRKTFNIWRSWGPASGLNLHPLQIQIARRGARLLQVGGLMVYSTCSLNPIEDEAVVSALLTESEGTLELVDHRHLVPGLKVRPGLHTWQLLDVIRSSSKQNGQHKKPKHGDQNRDHDIKNEDGMIGDSATKRDGDPLPSIEEALAETNLKVFTSVEEDTRKRFRKTCFPPSPEVAAQQRLELCMRCLPHDQDTGGFFVAVLRKLAPYPTKKLDPTATGDSSNSEPTKSTGEPEEVFSSKDKEGDFDMKGIGTSGGGGPIQNPPKAFVAKEFFVPFPLEGWQGIKEYYGINEDFPRERLFLRRDAFKVISFLTEGLVRDLKILEDSNLQLVHVGIKMFDKASRERSACDYRLAQDGLPYLLPYMAKRVVHVNRDNFVRMLVEGHLDLLSLPETTKNEVAELQPGGFVCLLDPQYHASYSASIGGEKDIASFALVLWKGTGRKLNIMCGKSDLFVLKYRLKAAGLATAEELVDRVLPSGGKEKTVGSHMQIEKALDEKKGQLNTD